MDADRARYAPDKSAVALLLIDVINDLGLSRTIPRHLALPKARQIAALNHKVTLLACRLRLHSLPVFEFAKFDTESRLAFGFKHQRTVQLLDQRRHDLQSGR
jgi:hypothetical protein